MSNKLLNETLRAVRRAGFAPAVENRRHIHVVWRDDAGHRHRVVISRSPSDINAAHSNRGAVRRQLSNSHRS
jgi:hypothetical protein